MRSRRALAMEQQRSERLLLNVLPAPIAAGLKQTDGVIADAFPEATVLSPTSSTSPPGQGQGADVTYLLLGRRQ